MAHFTTMTPEALERWTTARHLNRYADKRAARCYTKVNTVESSDGAFEEEWEVSGLGTLSLIPEGTAVAYDQPVQGNRTRITHRKFGLGYRVTEEMQQDDKWKVVSRMADDLLDSSEDHRERLGHAVWNDAFTGSTYTGLDGVRLCSTAHTSLKGGGTRSNAAATPADLAPESVEALLTQARLTVDDQGRYLDFKPRTLFTHTNNEWEAQRIFDSTQRPGTADNDINTMNRLGMSMVFSPYLTDTDAFFLIDLPSADVKFYDRSKPTTKVGTDFDTGDMKTKLSYRAGVGFYSWGGVFGSAGA